MKANQVIDVAIRLREISRDFSMVAHPHHPLVDVTPEDEAQVRNLLERLTALSARWPGVLEGPRPVPWNVRRA